jgi:UPF0716 protein FxsA
MKEASMWLFALFLIVPLIEIALFITVGGWLTLWPTLALVMLTGVVGTVLMRWQGLKVLAELRGDLGQLRNPLSPLAHGALIVLAGLLLLTPGFFTDCVGFLLMVPKLREAVIGLVGSRIQIQTFRSTTQTQHRAGDRSGGPTVIDGEYFEVEENPPSNPPSGWTRH